MRIDLLSLSIQPGVLPWDPARRYDTVGIAVNGRDLRDWLLRADRSADSSSYLGRSVHDDLPALLHGRAASGDPDYNGKVALLTCSCTDIGCGPLLARVTVDDGGADSENTVTWTEFAGFDGQPLEYGPPHFTFDRAAYDAEIARFADELKQARSRQNE